MKKFYIMFCLFFSLPFLVFAQKKTVDLYLFYGEGCPHCARVESYIYNDLMNEFSNLQLYKFEVYHSSENLKKFSEFAQAYGITTNAVPTLLIGERSVVGEDYVGIHQAVEYYSQIQAINPIDFVEKYKNENNISHSDVSDNENLTEMIGYLTIGALLVIIIWTISRKLIKKQQKI